jgi:hypothetical protein
VGGFVSEFLCLASFCLSVTFFFEKTLFGFEFGVVSLLSGLDIPVRFSFASQSTCGGCCCSVFVFVFDFPFRGKEEVRLLRFSFFCSGSVGQHTHYTQHS